MHASRELKPEAATTRGRGRGGTAQRGACWSPLSGRPAPTAIRGQAAVPGFAPELRPFGPAGDQPLSSSSSSRGRPCPSMATKVNTPSVTFSGSRPRPRPLAQVSTFTATEVSPAFTSEQ